MQPLREHTAIVIPCYNAGPRVEKAVRAALTQSSQVIVVDDGCTDGCMDAVAALPVRCLAFSRNRGKGHALMAGIRAALALPEVAAIALMDADGQHDARELPALLDAFQASDADLVIGSRRFDRSTTPWRSRFGNQVTAWIMTRLFGVHLPDTQCGFRILSPRFARDFVHAAPGGRYETEMHMIMMALRGGYRLISTPIATYYEPGNISSHFRKVRDSARIYGALICALPSRNPRPQDGKRCEPATPCPKATPATPEHKEQE